MFFTQVEAAGLQFLPLPGNADFNDYGLGEPTPELWTAACPRNQASHNDECRSPLLGPLEGIYNR
jgi:hypothetical protein